MTHKPEPYFHCHVGNIWFCAQLHLADRSVDCSPDKHEIPAGPKDIPDQICSACTAGALQLPVDSILLLRIDQLGPNKFETKLHLSLLSSNFQVLIYGITPIPKKLQPLVHWDADALLSTHEP